MKQVEAKVTEALEEFSASRQVPMIVNVTARVRHGRLWKFSMVMLSFAALVGVVIVGFAFSNVIEEKNFYKEQALNGQEELRCRGAATNNVNQANSRALQAVLEGLATAFGQDDARYVEIISSVPAITADMREAVEAQEAALISCQTPGEQP